MKLTTVLTLLACTFFLCAFELYRFNEQSEKMIIKNNYIENGKVTHTKVFTANLSEACIKNN